MRNDVYFMGKAIQQAENARRIGEVPVGAVVVLDEKVIARGYNKRECKNDATCHAEILAITAACRRLGRWRLSGCTLYVTLEPCAMCAGAIVNARLQRVVFGAYDPKGGACGSVVDLLGQPLFNHLAQVTGGVLESQCGQLLSDFFKDLRRKK